MTFYILQTVLKAFVQMNSSLHMNGILAGCEQKYIFNECCSLLALCKHNAHTGKARDVKRCVCQEWEARTEIVRGLLYIQVRSPKGMGNLDPKSILAFLSNDT